MQGWTLFATVFGLIFAAELPDKTAFACVLLGTRYRRWPLFLGVAGAYAVQSGVAIALGSLINLLPARPVHIGSSVLFLVLGLVLLRPAADPDEAEDLGAATGFWKTAGAAFVAIFMAEFGDLTQLATATLVARYHAPLIIFTASTLALWAVGGLSIFVGSLMKGRVRPSTLRLATAIAMLAVGAWMLWDALR